MPSISKLESVLAVNDPGDDTLERYRYQITYTAILGLSLLDEPCEHDYLYCEHHEDVMLKRTDGCYCGIQIKTQGEGYDPFKAGDEPIRNSILRFRDLEANFPGCFHHFVLAANCGFWVEKKDKSNLRHVLSLARQATLPYPTALSGALKRLDADTSKHGSLVAILKKVEIQQNLPHLKDIDSRLILHLSEIDLLRRHDYGTLAEIGQRLVARIFQASSHGCEPKYKDYCAILQFPSEKHALSVISGKRIDSKIVAEVIASCTTPSAVVLRREGNPIPPLPATLSRLQKRMATGYISVDDVELMSDMANSTEARVIAWSSKYGFEHATPAYNRLRVMVWNECREAQMQHQGSAPYGVAMLADVRQRLRHRANELAGQIFDSDYDLLLGLVGTLTQEGKVWWSPKYEEGE
jgi:hypothetical protein